MQTDHKSAVSLRRRALLLAGACGLAVPTVRAQGAASYPNKPIQLIVASPAGGAADAVARPLAEELARELGQPVMIDNRPGAGGVLALEAAVRAPADGHTLTMTWIGNIINQILAPRPNLDLMRDFVHIGQVVEGYNILVARPGLGVNTLQDLIAMAKSKPGKLNYASQGNGSSGHLSMEMLKQRAGMSLLHIPYRAGAPALTDLMGGQIDVMFVNVETALPQLGTGRLVALAVSSPARLPSVPNLPTVAEMGFPGFVSAPFAGLSAPRGTPAPVVERLHAALGRTLAGPVRAKLEANGGKVTPSTPEQYTDFLRNEFAKWDKLIKTVGIKLD
jgi:tripartite-type tricarboxylate transporter receptor subunit TctC